MKRQIAGMLAAAMCLALFGQPGEAAAAAKPKLSKSSLKLEAGSSKKLQVKKAKGTKITWKSSNKKVAGVKKAGKFAAKVTGKGKGKANIICSVKGKKTYTLKCRITVTKKTKKKADPATTQPSAGGTGNPVVTPPVNAVASPTVMPTEVPTASSGAEASKAPGQSSKKPDATLKPEVKGSILESYGTQFNYLGTCLNYEAYQQLQDANTLNFVKKQFNSFTLENEMKPDALLGGEVTGITKDEALAQAYVVPDNYADPIVPQLRFEKLDKALQVAKDNGLKMRAHTLVWHSQTPSWFFNVDYTGRKTTTPENMDARMEFYICSVMKHVMEKEKELTGEVGSIVYAWDVVNEYLNRSTWGKTWDTVYGNKGMEPAYVKKAFQLAYGMLEQYGAQDKVALVNNDFDTYFNADEIVALVNFINEGEKTNICNAIGMQSHVDITRPTLDEYGAALDKFLATGLEIQITELDVTINFDHEGKTWQYIDKKETDEQQAAFVSDFMKLIIKKQTERDKTVNPKGITGITIWGLYDTISWRAACSPLLFKNGIDDPKPSFYAFLDAAK